MPEPDVLYLCRRHQKSKTDEQLLSEISFFFSSVNY